MNFKREAKIMLFGFLSIPIILAIMIIPSYYKQCKKGQRIAASCSNSKEQDTTIKTSPEKITSLYPNNYESCDFMIDIHSWDEIYFRKPTILGPDLKTYKTDKRTLEKILKEKLSPDQVIVINKHRDCLLSDDKIRQWAEAMGITNIMIQPLSIEHENSEDFERLKPLAI